MPSFDLARQWRSQVTWRDIRNVAMAVLLILVALGCAVSSSFAVRQGNPAAAAVLAGLSLILAAGIALTCVPSLFRKARQEWVGLPFSFTKEGWMYLAVLTVIAVAAVNTGNNLIYIILSASLAALLVSGILSRFNLTCLRASTVFPDVIHARLAFQAVVTLRNEKSWAPAVSIQVEPRFSYPQNSRRSRKLHIGLLPRTTCTLLGSRYPNSRSESYCLVAGAISRPSCKSQAGSLLDSRNDAAELNKRRNSSYSPSLNPPMNSLKSSRY